ncbi:uroporphyrinogen-III synthase [Pseudorhodobacter turbinis]|nr:uroporphyrinogen-III synthase [Pseudorhodobacter turbinis]
MTTQSQMPAFLLTRPLAYSQRYAATLQHCFGPGLSITISPLIAPRLLQTPFPTGPWDWLILTSETGVAAYAQHPARPSDLPKRAFCVGDRTAKAAQQAGLETISADADAVALIALIQKHSPDGQLLHICGAHRRGDVAGNLTNSGIPTKAFVLYEQEQRPLSVQAANLLSGKRPVLAPLFSPRTAAIFAGALADTSQKAPLICATLSDAVTDALAQHKDITLCPAAKPTAAALTDAIKKYLAARQAP